MTSINLIELSKSEDKPQTYRFTLKQGGTEINIEIDYEDYIYLAKLFKIKEELHDNTNKPGN